jgi:hypothetical protein
MDVRVNIARGDAFMQIENPYYRILLHRQGKFFFFFLRRKQPAKEKIFSKEQKHEK